MKSFLNRQQQWFSFCLQKELSDGTPPTFQCDLCFNSYIPILPFLQNLSTVVSAASKLAQLQCLWQTRDSEQVSATTWGLAIYTCAGKQYHINMFVEFLSICFFPPSVQSCPVLRDYLKFFSEVVCHSLSSKSERKWLIQCHPVGFVPQLGRELLIFCVQPDVLITGPNRMKFKIIGRISTLTFMS